MGWVVGEATHRKGGSVVDSVNAARSSMVQVWF